MWCFCKLPADLVSLSISPLPETPADHDPAARETPTRKGTVLWFDKDKGYGRIRRAEGGGTVIVHQCAVERSGLIGLFPGQKVEFDLVPWVGCHLRAENLRLIAACGE